MMQKKPIELSEILAFLGDMVIRVEGSVTDVSIDNLADVEHTIPSTLDWVNPAKKNAQVIAEHSNARVILVGENVTYSDAIRSSEKTLVFVKNPKMAIAKVGNAFFVKRPVPGIHPTAIIDPEAQIGSNVYIGPYVVIGKATIGDNCVIESHVRIYDDVHIGHHCKIFSHVVLGGESFGPEKDEEGNLFRFPQLGSLIIGNYVEIASMTCVDKGALSDTIIGDYTKIDSLCKVSHNNVVGKNVVITGCVSIAGSNVIEDGVWIGPNSSLVEWGHIGKNSLVGVGSVVLRNVKEETRVFGNPAKPIDI